MYNILTSSDWALPQLTSTIDYSDFSTSIISPSLSYSLLETYPFTRDVEISQVPKRYVRDHALLYDSGSDVDTKTFLSRIQVYCLPQHAKGRPIAIIYISELNHFTFVTA